MLSLFESLWICTESASQPDGASYHIPQIKVKISSSLVSYFPLKQHLLRPPSPTPSEFSASGPGSSMLGGGGGGVDSNIKLGVITGTTCQTALGMSGG